MSNTTSGCQLWMGGLEHYMTENFIMNAFHKMGEKPSAIKVMRSRYTGEPAGYGFIHFNLEEEAISAMHKLNGKVVPNSAPPVRFRLNLTNSSKPVLSDREYSLWVGELSSEVDDHMLYKTFASRYQTLLLATVAKDSLGFCKGYGFLRFRSEEDMKHCVAHMNGFKGLGSKPIKVSVPLTKSHKMPSSVQGGYSSSQDYSSSDPKLDPKSESKNQEMSYWQSYSVWQSYDESDSFSHKLPPEVFPQGLDLTIHVEDELELIEHNTKLDIDSSNRELTQRDYNFWDALECSKWMPVECYD